MKAEVGDRIVVASGTLHRPIRDGEILQVGEGGGGPYLVRWSDSGNESLFFPGPDAHVEHAQRESAVGGQQSSAAPQHRRTPCCTAMCRRRSTFGGRLVAARPIRICPRLATRWRRPVP
jgi:hypothetical protein